MWHKVDHTARGLAIFFLATMSALPSARAAPGALRLMSDLEVIYTAPQDTGEVLRDTPPPAESSDSMPAVQANPMDADISAFYQARNSQPAWSGSAEAEENAAIVRDVLGRASEQGLRPRDYVLPTSQGQDSDTSQYDRAFTKALFRYAYDVRFGRVSPTSVYPDVFLGQQRFDIGPYLARAMERRALGQFLADLPPQQPGYRALVTALARFRALGADGGSSSVGAGGEGLAQRLAVDDGELAANPAPSESDVRMALMRFQWRNGLSGDGVLGPRTVAALNAGPSQRVQQIIVNMERWRWLPRSFERRYVVVNVADQSLDYVSDGQSLLHSRVIVGKPETRTPILITEVRSMVANPAWHVPYELAKRSILPHARKGSNYLATRNMYYANGGIVQRPGPNNALGKIMLDMPNDFDVYMHDTPNRELFLADERERSNGCVRVEEVRRLAALVLSNGTSDTTERIDATIGTGETRRISLTEPVPVYLLYWTVAVDSEGGIHFYPDRYRRDPPLAARLGATLAQAKPQVQQQTPEQPQEPKPPAKPKKDQA